MIIIDVNIHNLRKLEDDVVVIMGNFDGLHLGHQKLIGQAKHNFKKVAILTFSPHPKKVINNSNDFCMLTPLAKKVELFKTLKIDYFLKFDFNEEFMRLDKYQFINILKNMNITNIICGQDYAFGYKASGSVYDLNQHFNVNIVEKFVVDSIRVSSTLIKNLLSDGAIVQANKYLHRFYSVIGKVIRGNQIGTLIGFPTANLETYDYYLPKQGVYITTVNINGILYPAMTNIGHNPTLNHSDKLKVETHILNFKGNVYTRNIELFFHEFLRNELSFPNKEQLIYQLQDDARVCMEYFIEKYSELT